MKPIDPDVLFDMLLLTDEDVSLSTIQGWTPQQRAVVEKWAANVIMRASDNYVKVPPRPAILDDVEK